MDETAHAPLILTLDLDSQSFAFFDEQRRTHFPPDRNWLNAHLTLFHHLPGESEQAIARHLAALASRHDPLPLRVTGLRLLGRGVAYEIECPELQGLRTLIASVWWERLASQDRQPFKPHITVQNKVDVEAARALHAGLSRDFQPFVAAGTGLLLWRYIGPTWKAVAQFPFSRSLGRG